MSPFRLLFGFNGRINRKQYWIGLLGVWMGAPVMFALVALALFGPLIAAGDELDMGQAMLGFFGVILLYGAVFGAAGIAMLAITAKRLHDIGQSGFWCLLLSLTPSPLGLYSIYGATQIGGASPPLYSPGYMIILIAFAVFVAMIVLGCLRGQGGANRWGDPPGGAPIVPAERIVMATAASSVTDTAPPTTTFGRKPAH